MNKGALTSAEIIRICIGFAGQAGRILIHARNFLFIHSRRSEYTDQACIDD